MAIPQLEYCCCGCTLKTGTKVIGWISLVATIFQLVITSVALTSLFYLQDHADTPEKRELLPLLPVLKAVAVALIIVYAISCAFAVILLLGTYQNKAKFVYIWVIAALTSVILQVIMTIVQIVSLNQPAQFSNMILHGLDLYFILVVYSFYREIKNVSSQP